MERAAGRPAARAGAAPRGRPARAVGHAAGRRHRPARRIPAAVGGDAPARGFLRQGQARIRTWRCSRPATAASSTGCASCSATGSTRPSTAKRADGARARTDSRRVLAVNPWRTGGSLPASRRIRGRPTTSRSAGFTAKKHAAEISPRAASTPLRDRRRVLRTFASFLRVLFERLRRSCAAPPAAGHSPRRCRRPATA